MIEPSTTWRSLLNLPNGDSDAARPGASPVIVLAGCTRRREFRQSSENSNMDAARPCDTLRSLGILKRNC
jgi:hypothetical protein